MGTLTSSGSFTVADGSTATTTTTTSVPVVASTGFPTGTGRLVHPTLGAFDYQYKPDEWFGVDGDVIVVPTWAATKTLSGAAVSLWQGNIQDSMVQEVWNGGGGGAIMPVTQLRMLLSIWMNPVDPAVGYVQWFPSYVNSYGYNVLPVDLNMGNANAPAMGRMNGVATPALGFDDVIHSLNEKGNPNGWVTKQVTFSMKVVSRIG